MARRTSFRFLCATLGLPGLLALTLPACAGSSDALGPDPEPPHPNPPHHNPPPAPPEPGPQQPIVAGRYVLLNINEAAPGQMVTLANPDGLVIGIYRFDPSTMLVVDPLQTWSLQLEYADDKQGFTLGDEGDLTWSAAENGIALNFRSVVYGDEFPGFAGNNIILLQYDFDGDGRLDTSFGFGRLDD
jgi:hypothetical protein